MPNIKPISDLRNYTVGNPVFLTQNGRRRYVIIDIDEFEKAQSALKLMGELSKGVQSAKGNIKQASHPIEFAIY